MVRRRQDAVLHLRRTRQAEHLPARSAAAAPRRSPTCRTGIAGITPTSPALSIASAGSRVAMSIFVNSGYEIQFADASRRAAAARTAVRDDARAAAACAARAASATELASAAAAICPQADDVHRRAGEGELRPGRRRRSRSAARRRARSAPTSAAASRSSSATSLGNHVSAWASTSTAASRTSAPRSAISTGRTAGTGASSANTCRITSGTVAATVLTS